MKLRYPKDEYIKFQQEFEDLQLTAEQVLSYGLILLGIMSERRLTCRSKLKSSGVSLKSSSVK